MQTVSTLFSSILESNNYRFETKLLIGSDSYLIDEHGDIIMFGEHCIYYEADSGGFAENMLLSVKTSSRVFSEDSPAIGCCVAAEIDVEMRMPTAVIERRAELRPFIRAVDDSRESEWLPKGVFYVDTREDDESNGAMAFHGYDAMLKADVDFPEQGDIEEWPKRDIDVVYLICEIMGVEVDQRTVDIMQRGYMVEYPAGYSCKEILGYIAAMYAANFVMSDAGKLRLIRINEIGVETNYLVDAFGNIIIFGFAPGEEVSVLV